MLCDTVGHVTPDGVRNLIDWTRDLIDKPWHGMIPVAFFGALPPQRADGVPNAAEHAGLRRRQRTGADDDGRRAR